jgi:hypothetical protein
VLAAPGRMRRCEEANQARQHNRSCPGDDARTVIIGKRVTYRRTYKESAAAPLSRAFLRWRNKASTRQRSGDNSSEHVF